MTTPAVTESSAPFRQGLLAHADALELARQAVRDLARGAPSSARRIARALRLAATEHGIEDVAQFARLLEESPDAELAGRIDLLLAAARRTCAPGVEQPVTVLAVEDDPFFRGLLSAALLRPGRDLIFAGSAADAERLVGERQVGLVVLDLGLPDADGRDLLLRLRMNPRTATLPILVVSARGEALSRAECFALGADAFFEKPLQLEAFATAVAARLQRNGTGPTPPVASPATGVPLLNRGELHQAFLNSQQSAHRAVQPLTLALVDLDVVRAVNDTYGHPAGDAVIAFAVAVLSEVLGPGASIARWTGEELGVLLPNTSRLEARDRLLRGLDTFCSRRFEAPGKAGRTYAASFTAGVAQVPPDAGFPDAFSRAEAALRYARAAGRNAVLCAPPLGPSRPRVLVIEDDDLTAAVIRHLLVQEGYEPVVCTSGAAGLALAEEVLPSLALLAVRPTASETGAFVRQFRQLPAVGRRPILVIQARKDARDAAQLLGLGVQDVIAKPLPPMEFIARVHQLAGQA